MLAKSINENDEIKNNREISYEVADILIYLLMFSSNMDINIEKTIMEKLAIDREKYPAL